MDSDGSLVSDSDNSDESDDTDDGKPPDAAIRPKRNKTPKISALMSHVYAQVDLLYHLALLLRRPAVVGRYIKSATKRAEISVFAQHDYNHVQEKFRYWRSVAELEETEPAQCTDSGQLPSETWLGTPNSQETTPQVEQARSQSDLEARRRMESEETSYDLICRLGRANTRRREQLSYWATHPVRSAIDSEGPLGEGKPPARRLPAPDSAQRSPSRAGEDAMANAQPHGKHGAKSFISTPTTVVSHSTAAVSRVDGARTQAGPPPTIYAETVVGTGLRSIRVPDPPDPGPGNPQFECPFCYAKLETVLMKDRASWK